jgi:membrane glycosyltransferase
MHENPQLAILQHSSGVLQVGAAGFERCMTYFTRTIYTAMEWAVASGDDAPFLGHNAFIRWTSLRELSYTDNDGEEKWWSESHVSEDFDLSIRLHVKGYVVRLATYHEGGFKEGVSLHIYDEIARWQKYIYGCNEIVFYPLRFWLFRGPLTIAFRYFLWSNLLITSKFVDHRLSLQLLRNCLCISTRYRQLFHNRMGKACRQVLHFILEGLHRRSRGF